MGESKSRTQLVAASIFLCLLLGCRAAPPPKDLGVPRISPAYVQWLEQQSMLGQSQDLISQVSGTQRILQNSGTEERYPLLLREAPTWVSINPHTSRLPHPIFSTLATDTLLQGLNDCAIQGIYLAPTGETADIWSAANTSDPKGRAVTGFVFTKSAGTEADFRRLRTNAAAHTIQLGGALPPAATGIGPDFLLQTRGLSHYAGLYTAVTIPKDAWPLLPQLSDERDVAALPVSSFAALVAKGLLPERLHRHALSWAPPSGWAATAPLRGIDGNTRRFVYCYDTSPDRPILFWQDPSGLAKRLYAAAAIRHTGLQQHTLTALPLKALMGLDPLRPGEHSPDPSHALEPGLSALGDLTQMIHRYGGWCVTDEDFPPKILAHLLTKTDFVGDHLLPRAIAGALRQGESAPLAAALLAYHKHAIPLTRLAHGLGLFDTEHEDLLIHTLLLALPGLTVLPEDCALGDVAHTLRLLLIARAKLNAAMGTVLTPSYTPPNKGCLVLINKLPEGGLWCVAVNFSRTEHMVALPEARSSTDVLIDLTNAHTLATTTRTLALPPRQARHVFLGPRRALGDYAEQTRRAHIP